MSEAMFTLRQLELFCAATSTGSFAAAAEAMFVTPTTVAAAVGELEKILGTQLLSRRRAQGVVPTAAGTHLYRRATELLHEADEVRRSIAGNGGEFSGPLSVGCYSTLAATVLPGLVQGFTALHPRIEVSFVDGTLDQLLNDLRKGELDLAIAYRVHLPPDVDDATLYESTQYVFLGADHALAEAPSVSLHDLVDEPLILLDLPPSARHTMDLFHQQGLKPNVAHRTASFELVRSLVARGLGYSILLQRPRSDSSYEGLPIVAKTISPGFPPSAVVVFWRSDVRLTDRAKALIEYARRTVMM
jgi:DNA-binding transcriptional LysR family regulator